MRLPSGKPLANATPDGERRLVPTCRREATSEGSDCRRHVDAVDAKVRLPFSVGRSPSRRVAVPVPRKGFPQGRVGTASVGSG
ncbi:hypothetical protein ACF3DV_31460 [Chlorogloeopsis fritschii PCC 9212]|uniref:hypothetical protein n=1 Tax=Chlorogloeopsis fritschii TaxID=1124 RepID=UPI000F8D4F40|nr:hypothetical protein [Chlorogloeopsis fritschii]